MSKIKAVIFDVGGVLVYWGNDIYDDLREELGLSDESLNKLRTDYFPPFGRGEITEAEMWKKASAGLGIRQVKLEENLIGRTFARTFIAYQDVIDFVESLKKRGVKVAILSNTNPVHSQTVKENKVYEPFKDVFLSHEVGMRKPDPQIFKHVLQKLKLEPDEAVFVDDGPENIEAAKKLGMHTVLAKKSEQIINDIEKLIA